LRASNYYHMHSFFTLRRIFFLSILSIAFFTGCTRISTTDIGSGLIPPIDGVITKDTLMDVITDTFDDTDSVRVYSGDNMMLGAITNDPLFGKSKASIFFEVKPAYFPFYIPGHKDSLKVDSAVLCLSYRGVYGDTLTPITLRVSEINLNTPLNILYSYPANFPFTPPVQIGASMGPAKILDIRRLGDSVYNRFEATQYQVRIKLDNAVATRFLKTYDSTTAYKSDSIFKTYFAGIALTADASGGVNSLLKINLADTNTKLQLYYSTASTGASVRDTNVAKLVFTSGFCAFANEVSRDRSGSQINAHITTTSKPDSLVYVQTAPGTYVRIRVPGLQSLANRIIHRAELIAEQVPDDANLGTLETYLLPPRYLLLSHFDSTTKSKRSIPNDYIIGQDGNPNIAAFGGYKVTKSINGYDRVGAYNFDLSRFVQGVVTRKDTAFTLRLSAPGNDSLHYSAPYPSNAFTQTIYLSPTIGNDIGDGRVRLGGGTHSRFRMRLRVIFSRI
jgi:hypothetical protein